ncbi:LuxR C-terminal-related transcriptional regulator [Streptomyces sp. NPDC101206]|uniref:LuxR C-terminal-related transcriptional regulator n=1 Tax=Streptomyces sp. NPDC101206 TaxID=3366128 RepID=UPI003813637F
MGETAAPRSTPRTAAREPRGGRAFGVPVLPTRFAVPSVPHTFVRRPRLTQRLADGVDRPLVLVNGPAGAGKTLLVADWLARDPLPWPVAWLTTEADDNAPGMFWAYVLEALRHHGLPLPDDVGTPARAEEVDHALLVRFAAHLSGLRDPVLLVLDEFDRVSAPVIAEQLAFVLQHSRPALHLVLISRTEPLLPLHRYRAGDEMVDIRGADLAFNQDETAALLDRHGLDGGPEAARLLTERTEGWAAGVRLCALAMDETDDPARFLKEFEAGRSTVADYLLGEVLATQPFETQDLLLRTSILEQTHPDLANALTGREDGAAILASLERANAFVTAVGHSWYRHHPLFAEILRVHLRSGQPGLERELHRTAARWLSGAGQLVSALPHAAAAGDWEYAAARFVGDLAVGGLFTGLDADRLGEVFAAMAPGTPGPAPELVRAALAFARYDVTGGLDRLRAAEEPPARDPHDPENVPELPPVRLTRAFLRVVAGRLAGSAAMAEAGAADAAAAARHVPPEHLARHPELDALLLTGLGAARLWAGHLDAAAEALRTAADSCEGPGTASPRHEALARLALIDLLQGRLGRAEARAREAAAEATRNGLLPAHCSGAADLVPAAVALERDDLAAAGAALDRAAESAGAHDDPVVAAGLAVLRARLLLAGGDPTGSLAQSAAAVARPPAGEPSPWADAHLALAASAAHLALGDPKAALAALGARAGLPAVPTADTAGAKDADAAAVAAARAGAPWAAECAVAAARAWIAGGESARAIEVLDPLTTGGAACPAVTVRALLARAEAADGSGDPAAVRRLVIRALGLARPERLRRPFLDAGPWLRRALHGRPVPGHDWLTPGPAGARAGGASRAGAGGGAGARPGAARPAESGGAGAVLIVEPLSEREHDVLACAAQLLSTEEIAAELSLSVNTVKTHLKSIYRKLSANRRGEAVRRARELELL